MSHQSKLTTKRSSDEVKLNGRRETKLKNRIFTMRSGILNFETSIMIMAMSTMKIKITIR